jgi:hypothetical protein
MQLPENKKDYFSKIIVNLIRSYPELKSTLQSEFPTIYADLESASTNPNCSCVRKVENELLNNKDRALNILNNFLSNKDNDNQINDIISVDYGANVPISLQGKMFTIENTAEAYAEFIRSLFENKTPAARGFSTSIDQNGKLNIYFI